MWIAKFDAQKEFRAEEEEQESNLQNKAKWKKKAWRVWGRRAQSIMENRGGPDFPQETTINRDEYEHNTGLIK